MFIVAPKNAAMPVSAPKISPSADEDLTDPDDPSHPGLGVVVDQDLEEVAIPLERDRGLAGVGIATALWRVPPRAPRRRANRRRWPSPNRPRPDAKPTNSRIGSHIRPARVLLNRYREKSGPSTSIVCPGRLAILEQHDEHHNREDPEDDRRDLVARSSRVRDRTTD